MLYRIAGIDVHKKMLAVAIADVEGEGEYQFEHLKVGTRPAQLRWLADWLVEHEVEEVVMESAAQYWRSVWEALERSWQPRRQQRAGAGPIAGRLHLAQVQSNRGPGGRKKDFPDAERLVKRLVAQELTLSFVPHAEQRLWRTVMRRGYQVTRSRVQLHNRLESLLEEAHIKLSSLVSDLLSASTRSMLQALAEGETNPATLAALADQRLRRRIRCATRSARARTSTPSIGGSSTWRSRHCDYSKRRSANSIRKWRVCSARTRRRCRGWPRCPGWVWIRRSRSSRKSEPPRRPFRRPSDSPRGWACAPAMRRARA